MGLINIEGFEIGGDKAYVIADIGSNHKQDLKLAKESIDAVVECGANAVKFQSIQLNELYFNPDRITADFVKQLEFPEDWHHILKEYCDKKGITFFSSPTYIKSVDLLEEVDVSLYKLASAQIGTFPQIVEKVAKLKKPTIFSTGIAGYEEIIRAVKIFKKNNNNNFIILHCNSIYPTPPNEVNLQLINTYKAMFNNPVGFSDHTEGFHIACSAVAMGANVIEKHFTLDRNLDTPDSNSFAADPIELKTLVENIRDIEASKNIYNDRIHIQPEELEFKNAIIYRCVASRNIMEDSELSLYDLSFLRHSEGIDARLIETLINKNCSVNRNIKKGELIRIQDLN